MRPSFIYHQIHAVISIIGTIIVLYWLIFGQNRDSYTAAILILLVSLSWGVHALVHFDEEVHYNYNPLIGKSIVHDEPTINKNN